MRLVYRFSFFLYVCFVYFSCSTRPLVREITTVDRFADLNPGNRYLKVHKKDGTLYVLENWHGDNEGNIVGSGVWMGVNRKVIERRSFPEDGLRPFVIPPDEVALLETNDKGNSLMPALAIVTGVTAIVTIICITNPKACFGSCPTFYAYTGDSLRMVAEAFSTSVLPSLEKRDIDMLYTAKYTPDFSLKLTNEALETHSINYANLLVFPKNNDERVFADPDGRFFRTKDIRTPSNCFSEVGDCRSQVFAVDGVEYFSPSDAKRLDSKEEIRLTFVAGTGQKHGLIIGKRQTMMTTYLLYQGLAYMGKGAGYLLAHQERRENELSPAVFDRLGKIEVYAESPSGDWVFIDEIGETGPIAVDLNIIEIPESFVQREQVNLKLILNKGLWRLDYAAFANVEEEVFPEVVAPHQVISTRTKEPDPLGRLRTDGEYLVTLPGDELWLHYRIPHEHAELFLDAKGYYLEWMRADWMKEQNFRRLAQMVNSPERYLKRVAKAYKEAEPTMEETFWKSRYVEN
jgi:hypothetical protein